MMSIGYLEEALHAEYAGTVTVDGPPLPACREFSILDKAFAPFSVEFTTETQREPLAPQTTRYQVVSFGDDGSLLLTVLGPGEGTGTFRLHPDGTLEHVLDLAPVGRCH
jgi:hypothetical protein